MQEQLHIEKVRKQTGRVRVRVVPQERTQTVKVPLESENVDVKRVAIDRVVSEAGPVRQEGEVTIVPVYEEVLVVEKRLVLKEEIHITKHISKRSEVKNVRLRSEKVQITRDRNAK